MRKSFRFVFLENTTTTNIVVHTSILKFEESCKDGVTDVNLSEASCVQSLAVFCSSENRLSICARTNDKIAVREEISKNQTLIPLADLPNASLAIVNAESPQAQGMWNSLTAFVKLLVDGIRRSTTTHSEQLHPS